MRVTSWKATSKTLLIPKLPPLLLLQLFAYGIVGLMASGILWTKWGKPGLAAWGITIVTQGDRLDNQEKQVGDNTAKILRLENTLTDIAKEVRILLEEVAPRRAKALPPLPVEEHRGG